jgi:hypothetical protein
MGGLKSVLPRMLTFVESNLPAAVACTLGTAESISILGMKQLFHDSAALEEIGSLNRSNVRRTVVEAAYIVLLHQQEQLQLRHVHSAQDLILLYPSFASIVDGEDNEESAKLLLFRNYMATAVCAVRAQNSKGYLLDLVTLLTGGWGCKYVTGTGQTRRTDCRVQIFLQEGGVAIRHRQSSRGRKKRKRLPPDQSASSSGSDSVSSLWVPHKERIRAASGAAATGAPPMTSNHSPLHDQMPFRVSWASVEVGDHFHGHLNFVGPRSVSLSTAGASSSSSSSFSTLALPMLDTNISLSQDSTGSSSSCDNSLVNVDVLYERYIAVSPHAVSPGSLAPSDGFNT